MSTSPLSALWSRSGLTTGPLGGLLRRTALLRSRRALLQLDDHLLRDIGLTRTEARSEATRPDWDVPPHWRG